RHAPRGLRDGEHSALLRAGGDGEPGPGPPRLSRGSRAARAAPRVALRVEPRPRSRDGAVAADAGDAGGGDGPVRRRGRGGAVVAGPAGRGDGKRIGRDVMRSSRWFALPLVVRLAVVGPLVFAAACARPAHEAADTRYEYFCVMHPQIVQDK